MKNFWTSTFRRLAAASAVAGSSAFTSAVCYAAVAMDSASDPTYADGWQDGDNGGFGFTAWNFDARYNGFGQYTTPGFKAIDDGLQAGTPLSSTFNNIGRAWTLGATPDDDGGNHVGRGFSLAVGETLKVTIDNPTARQFFKGYFVSLNGGTGMVDGNICPPASSPAACSPGGTPMRKMTFGMFDYSPPPGDWFLEDAINTSPPLLDTDTAAAGAVIKVKRTGADTYDFSVDSLGGSGDFTSLGRTFANVGAEVDWIEFTFFNTLPTDPPTATNFYISSMMIVPEPGSGVLLVLGTAGMLAGAAAARRQR